MVKFCVAGRADSMEYATCERLAEILRARLPDVEIATSMHPAAVWPVQAEEIARTRGYVRC